MRKTSKADFNRFKKAFVEWQEILNLRCYQIYFAHEELDGAYAELKVDESGKAATAYYCSKMCTASYNHRKAPESDARHEAIHLLLHRICFLGAERWTASGEIPDEVEKLVCILEKVL